MNRFGTKSRVAVALLAALLAMAAYDTRWGPAPCAAQATGFPLKPKMIFGLSIGFEPWVKAAFPVGSCEADLIAWMDRVGFGDLGFSSDIKFFENVSAADLKFALDMEEKGVRRQSRTFRQPAIIGDSIFTISWFTDKGRRITAIYARSNLFHFEWL